MSDIIYLGTWQVDFRHGSIKRRWLGLFTRKTLDGRLLQVLRTLVEHACEVGSAETLLQEAWPDRVVSRDSVTTAIYQLRQLLQDSTDNPKYIRSEARRGYRLVAKIRKAPAVRKPYLAAAAVASMAAVVAYGSVQLNSVHDTPTIFMEPLINYAESPVQEPLSTAGENTLLSELIRALPGGIRASDDGVQLRLQSMLVACDLGPALVVRLLDTSSETYVWSRTYKLDEMETSSERPTLVEQAATDIVAAIL